MAIHDVYPPYSLEELRQIARDNLAAAFPDDCTARLLATAEAALEREQRLKSDLADLEQECAWAKHCGNTGTGGACGWCLACKDAVIRELTERRQSAIAEAVAAEREACAVAVESLMCPPDTGILGDYRAMVDEIAAHVQTQCVAAIRARKES
jgi:hypothetical protein